MAIIAQAAMYHPPEMTPEEDLAKWYEHSVGFRDSVKDIAAAIRAKNVAAATAAAEQMTMHCDGCHADFREE
jgi:cytochrome c556